MAAQKEELIQAARAAALANRRATEEFDEAKRTLKDGDDARRYHALRQTMNATQSRWEEACMRLEAVIGSEFGATGEAAAIWSRIRAR